MVLDRLGEALKSTLSKVAGALFVDEKLVNELVKDIQRALLQADVNVRLVLELTNEIKRRILKEKIPEGLSKKEYLISVVYEELTKFLGGEEGEKIEISKKPFKIMLIGLFGNGKTTTAGKLAKFYKKRGHKIALVQTDTWRPAAYDQLEQLSNQIKVDFYGKKKEKNPVKIYNEFESKLKNYDIVIIDTAGRDALNEELTTELKAINNAVNPDETLLVMSADLGQTAEKQAKVFSENSSITGVIITKLDGTAKGGGALSACSISKAPVKFIGVGEKIDAFEVFRPKNFVGRLLGMGDIEALLEKAQEAITKEEAVDLTQKFVSGRFNLKDLYEQMEAMKKMGPLAKVIEMIPGMSNMSLPKELIEGQEEKMKVWKYIINSCTKEELEEPELLDKLRIERIAKGSGTSENDIRELLKHYKQSKKMMKMFKGMDNPKNMQKMMKKFKGLGNIGM